MLGMMSLLSGLTQGYVEGDDKKYQRDRQTKLDQVVLDRNAREQAAFDQEAADQQAIRTAAAPVAATPDTGTAPDGTPVQRMLPDPSGDNIDAGQPGTAPPVPSMAVAGRTGLSAPQATAAVADANSPAATSARVIRAMQAINPKAAAQLQEATLGVDEKTIDLANKRWNTDIDKARAKGLQGILEFTDATHADGEGGAVKSKAVVSPDGKSFTIVRVMPDGSEQPTKMPPMPNSDEGLDMLAASLQRGVPIQNRLAHWEQVRRDAREEKRDADTNTYRTAELGVRKSEVEAMDRYRTGELSINGRNVDSEIEYRRKLGDAAITKADAKASMADRMPEGAKITYQNALKRREKLEEAITKAKADGAWDPTKNDAHKSLQTDYDAANMQATVMEKRYADVSTPTSDPYPGVRAPASPGAIVRTGMAANPTMSQAQMDRDRPAILGRELANATDAGDRKSIESEIARLPKDQRARALAAAAPPSPTPTIAPPAAPAAAPVAAAPAAAAAPVPPPPPETIPGRVRTQYGMVDKAVPNPDFVAWRAQYGAAFDQQQAQATAAARASFRPEVAPYSMRRLGGS